MKKKVFTILMSAVLAFSLGACGSDDQKGEEGNEKTEAKESKESESKPVELSMMAWMGEPVKQQKLCSMISLMISIRSMKVRSKLYRNICPVSRQRQSFRTSMAANNAPDLFMSWSAGYLEPYVKAGKYIHSRRHLTATRNGRTSFWRV